MRAAVIANGETPTDALLREFCAAAAFVVCADGGLRHAIAAGIVPNAVVGDLDSVTPELRSKAGMATFHEDADPNTTDLQKSIDYALALGADDVDVLAAGGGRADHHLANLSVLTLYRGRAKIRLIDDLFETSLVEEMATIEAPEGTVVSLVALGECTGVTTSGMRWNLENATLRFSPYGIHNEVSASPATVRVRTGDLLLFRGRFVERHR